MLFKKRKAWPIYNKVLSFSKTHYIIPHFFWFQLFLYVMCLRGTKHLQAYRHVIIIVSAFQKCWLFASVGFWISLPWLQTYQYIYHLSIKSERKYLEREIIELVYQRLLTAYVYKYLIFRGQIVAYLILKYILSISSQLDKLITSVLKKYNGNVKILNLILRLQRLFLR